MRALTSAIAFALLLTVAAPVSASSGGGHAKAGPAGIPFACSDGRSLRIVYGPGGPRGTAELMFDGGEHHELKAAHMIMGNRYTSDLGDGRVLVWTSNAGTAALSEMSADGSETRELATCNRAGWGDSPAPAVESHETAH